MLITNKENFCSHLFALETELQVISETGDSFRGDRTAVSWLVDMFRLTQLIENKPLPQLEEMAFKLIAFYPVLYSNFASPNQSFEQMYELYDSLLMARNHFVNVCHTLTKVEQQQMERERTGRSEDGHIKIREDEMSRFRDQYWKRPLEKDHSFFRDIANYAFKFKKDVSEFFPARRKSSNSIEAEWCNKITGIFSRITYYPVSSMLMPVLLTKYIVEDMEEGYESVYAYMKPRKSSFPRNRAAEHFKENIQLLYDAIAKRIDELDEEWIAPVSAWYKSEVQKNMQENLHDTDEPYSEGKTDPLLSKKQANAALKIPVEDMIQVMSSAFDEYKRTRFQRGLPIISFSNICSVLQKKFEEKNYSFDKAQLWGWLEKYTKQNGLSYTNRTERQDAEQIIISIARLCTAECYLNCKCGIENKAIYEALDYLSDKHIIESQTVRSGSDTPGYFAMYDEFCETFQILEDDLSPLALCKYFRLESWSSLKRIEFFKILYVLVEKNLRAAKAEILSDFHLEPIIHLDIYDDLLKLFSILRKNFLASSDSDGYTNELELFVAEPNNFTYSGFQKFIEAKDASQESTWAEFHIPTQHREKIICELFRFTVDLTISVLLDHVRRCCVKQLEWYSDKKAR